MKEADKQSMGHFINERVDEVINQSISQLVEKSISQSISYHNRSFSRKIGESRHQIISRGIISQGNRLSVSESEYESINRPVHQKINEGVNH